MKKFLLTTFVLSVVCFNAQIGTSTNVNNEGKASKWTFGGGLGVGFGSNSAFNLQVAPRVD